VAGDEGIDKASQGDDYTVIQYNRKAAERILNNYQKMKEGLLNPLKNSIDGGEVTIEQDGKVTEREMIPWTEFLKNVITEKYIGGYPLRSLKSLLWNNPNTPDPLIVRINETVNRWTLQMTRSVFKREKALYGMRWYHTHFKKLMVSDLVGLTKYPESVILEILNTPQTVGGIGWLWDKGDGRTGLLEINKEIRMEEHVNVLGLKEKEFRNFFSQQDRVEVVKVKRAIAPRKVAPVKTGGSPTLRKGVSQMYIDAKIEEIVRLKDYSYWYETGYLRKLSERISNNMMKILLTRRVKIQTPPGSFMRAEEVSEIVSGYERAVETIIWIVTGKPVSYQYE